MHAHAVMAEEGRADEVRLAGRGRGVSSGNDGAVLHCIHSNAPLDPPPRCHRHDHTSPLPPPPHVTCTHIYPLQVAVGLRRGNHRVVGVDDGHDVHAQQLLQRAVQVLPLVVIVEVQICDEDLSTVGGDRGGPELYVLHGIVSQEF